MTPIKSINLGLNKTHPDIKEQFISKINIYKNTYTLIFTDASKVKDEVGFGINIPQIGYKYSSKLPAELCISTAEMRDSPSSINKLNNTSIQITKDYITLMTRRLIVETNSEILLAWIPGHSGLSGNENILANIGRKLNIPKTLKIDKSEIVNCIKSIIIDEHKADWKRSTTNKGKRYSRIQQSFPIKKFFLNFSYINRRHITTIIRMRTGHCLTGEHLHKIGIKDNPHCECGRLESLDHIFLECPINKVPNLDMYESIRKLGIKTPFSMETVLSNINIKIIQLVIQFLNHNRIKI